MLGSAAPAAAHATLISTDPADGAVLETAPEQVTFTFNESVIGVPAGIEVFDATGAEVASTASVRKAQLVVGLDEEVGEGTFVVVWRLVSADGHPIGGSLSFSVGQPSAEVDVPTTAAEVDTTAPFLLSVVRWLGYLGLLVAAGVAAFSVLFLPRDRSADDSRRRLRTTARIAAVVAALSWWAAVPLVALYQLGLRASALGDGSTWSALATDEYVVPALVLAGLAPRERRAARPRPPTAPAPAWSSSGVQRPSPRRRSPGTRAPPLPRRSSSRSTCSTSPPVPCGWAAWSPSPSCWATWPLATTRARWCSRGSRRGRPACWPSWSSPARCWPGGSPAPGARCSTPATAASCSSRSSSCWRRSPSPPGTASRCSRGCGSLPSAATVATRPR